MKFKKLKLRFLDSVFLAVVFVLGLVLLGVASAPSSWQVGSYWTYQEMEQAQSSSLIPTETITYYVVARTDLLEATMCAVTRVDKSPGGKTLAIWPLTIHVFKSGTLRPQVWPFPAPGAPIMVAKEKGTMLGEGGSQMTEVTYPQGKGKFLQQFEIQQNGTEKVTVPAGVFPNALRFDYQEKINMPAGDLPGSQQTPGQYSWQAGGTAWWSDKIAGWVQVEEHGQESDGRSYAYKFVLSDWGRLSEKDLKEQLSTAITDIASVDPVMAVMIGRQLQEIGIDLKDE